MGASSLVVPSRAGTVSMAFPDNSWRKSYDGKGGVAAGPAVNASPTAFTLGGGGGGAAPAARAAAPAATGGATVVQAMKFMQDPSVTNMPVEAKAAFLASKGVDAYAISQAACVSGGMYECFGPVQTEKYA